MIPEESLESLLGLVDRGARKLAHILSMDEEVLDLRSAQLWDQMVRIMFSKLTHPSGVVLDCFGIEPCKLDKTLKVLIPLL